jgi:hypothetical protein
MKNEKKTFLLFSEDIRDLYIAFFYLKISLIFWDMFILIKTFVLYKI